MEQITLQEASISLVNQLQSKLARLAVAGDSGLSTYHLEDEAKKLASKLKSAAEFFGSFTLYKGKPEGGRDYNFPDSATDEEFAKFAYICKKCGKEQLEAFKVDGERFVKVSDGLYVKLVDIPSQDLPEFKVKLEGDTLMAVRTDLLEKLPSCVQKLLSNKEEE